MASKRKPAPSKPVPTIIDTCHDADLCKDWFAKHPESWLAWFCFLKVLFGLPLDEAELAIFQACTGRSAPSPGGYNEATLICGRRAGKSLILALIACYLAVFRDYRPYLTAGERGTIMIIASDRKQCQSIFRYLKGFLGVPTLAGLIERETAEVLELSNQVSIEVQTASFRTLRGRTVVASLNDELGFWRTDDGASPDTEIFAALRPAMLTIPGAMLFKASSPYAQKGVLWDDHKRYYGNDDAKVLVWKASSKTMHPIISQSFLDEELERDPASFASEYLAEFRAGISEWLSREVIDAAIDTDIVVRQPNLTFSTYSAFVDSAGGGGKDSFTLAIAHLDNGSAILDHLTEIKPPFAASEAVSQISKTLKLYGLSECSGDKYAGGIIPDLFAGNGITYRHSTRDRSAIYVDALPLFSSARIRLLDIPRLTAQLAGLERKSGPAGRDRIDHARGQHDDLANSACGALVNCSSQTKRTTLFFGSVESGRSLPTYYGF
jgi:hypothetical protein